MRISTQKVFLRPKNTPSPEQRICRKNKLPRRRRRRQRSPRCSSRWTVSSKIVSLYRKMSMWLWSTKSNCLPCSSRLPCKNRIPNSSQRQGSVEVCSRWVRLNNHPLFSFSSQDRSYPYSNWITRQPSLRCRASKSPNSFVLCQTCRRCRGKIQ